MEISPQIWELTIFFRLNKIFVFCFFLPGHLRPVTIFKATVFLYRTLPVEQNKKEAGMSQADRHASDSYFLGKNQPECHGWETLIC